MLEVFEKLKSFDILCSLGLIFFLIEMMKI